MGSPTRFLAFNKKVQFGLNNTRNLPDSILPLKQLHSEKVDVLDTIHHQALDGGRSLIRDREKLSQEIVVLLDQMASILDAAFILDPDSLLTTGYNVTQERRSPSKVREPMIAPQDFNVASSGVRGQALASASPFPGVVVYEIHINQKAPSVEADWFHLKIFHDAQNMVMENLAAGNTFVRMRHQGQDEAGPWSGVVSTTIT